MSWTLDGKIRIHARLSNTSYMRFHSWTSVSLRRLYIRHFLSLHFKDRDEDFPSKGLNDILHDNKIFSCTLELPNESTCLVVIFVCFVLFSFGMNLWPHVLTKNTGKSFIHMTKNKLFSYEIIRIIQQATSFSFVVLMVRITVIWLSVEYQNFFSFQGVTNAYPPHTVNVPFISSHIRVSRSSLVPNLSTWQFYFPCRLFFYLFFVFFFRWSWIKFFLRKYFL